MGEIEMGTASSPSFAQFGTLAAPNVQEFSTPKIQKNITEPLVHKAFDKEKP